MQGSRLTQVNLANVFLTDSNLLAWFPWLNFYTENAILQLLLLFALLLFSLATTLYYAAVYMFLFILLTGVFLAYYNLEVLTGFLLVVEFTAFFVIILFLMALNFESKLANVDHTLLTYAIILFLSYLFFFFTFSKPDSLDFLNATYYWDDYYADLQDDVMNDVFGLYLSYYNFNGVLFFLFGLMIFSATLTCVNFFKILRVKTQEHLVTLQYVYNFFRDLVSFDFLRKQNLSNQTRRKPATRLVRSRPKNVTKK